ncbi:hypothetical protein [Vibrio sp. Y20_XG_PY13]|uniref:hypothetical protein n=1 Tax=Vibrio sp. Y20_XG_PY13 TaxID=2957761 RepID=UPI0020A34182|nr:hypothetical protein [Vibrio sp. Y20_XG_PY13]
MAKLTDMEELASKIIDKNVQSYMREALTCYMTGAYRATIVLSYIALFDDILAKLDVLAKVNKKAKKIYDEVSKKRGNQEVFESDLINQLSSNNLLTSLDSTFLDILRQLRNKAAHPSGHKPSAEEARFIYFESINRFLSKEILSTTQLADEILASTVNKNLFPSTDITTIAKVVRKELESIHPDTYPYLISKLIEKVPSSDDIVSKNTSFFIIGLTFDNNDERIVSVVRRMLIEKKSQDEDYFTMIIRSITSNPSVLETIDDVTFKRLKVIIQYRISEVDSTLGHSRFSHPVSMFSSMFGVLNDEVISDIFETEFSSTVEKFLYSSYLLNNLSKSEYAKEKYIEILMAKAGSSDFEVANKFARTCYTIIDELDAILTDQNAFKLIVNLLMAASWNAFGAKDLRNAKFQSMPAIRDKARALDLNDKSEAKKIYKEVFGNDTDYENVMGEYVR